jgi:mannose-1-phosphate guanylyltransferase
MYGIIMAGGGGSRLWPHSRANTPKQLLALISDRTLIQETVARLLPLMPIENIVVVTGAAHAAGARAQLPDLPAANVLVEPAARGTAPAIGLGLIHIRRLAAGRGEADPVIGSFHADHVITDVAEFQSAVRDAASVAERGDIVTLGITPDRPHTGYGYIERGAPLPLHLAHTVYRVARFVEKPDLPTAEQYVAGGQYSWNSGMFLWRLSTILEEYARYLPDLSAALEEIDAARATPAADATLTRAWQQTRSETIDVGIAEKSQRMAVVPADFGWSDVGDWATVAELLAPLEGGAANNAVVGRHIGLDTTNSLLYSSVNGKLIATIGMDNVIVVDTGDVLLVCDMRRNQDVKKLVESLKALGLTEFL